MFLGRRPHLALSLLCTAALACGAASAPAGTSSGAETGAETGAGGKGMTPKDAAATRQAKGGKVLTALPLHPDPASRYLVYLHGAIIERGDRRPVHPRFGVYEYDAILQRFAAEGFVVVSEQRPAGTRIVPYARHVVQQVTSLLQAGVPASHVGVVGFSKGGAIALTAADQVANPGVSWVILAGCLRGYFAPGSLTLRGRVLSLYDQADDIAESCSGILAKASGAHEERELTIGAGHGSFYRPDPRWLEPALGWLERP